MTTLTITFTDGTSDVLVLPFMEAMEAMEAVDVVFGDEAYCKSEPATA